MILGWCQFSLKTYDYFPYKKVIKGSGIPQNHLKDNTFFLDPRDSVCQARRSTRAYPVSKAQYAGGEKVKLSEIKFWPCSVTQGKVINLSALLFPHLSKGKDNTFLTMLLWRLNKKTDINSLTQYLAPSKGLVNENSLSLLKSGVAWEGV